MRSLIVCNIMSVDGCYEGPGRNMMVLNMDSAFDAYNLERIQAAGTVLLGAASFEGFSSYWPGIADAPADPDNRALDRTNREISRVYNTLPKVVVSDTYTVSADNPWQHQTTVVPRNGVRGWLESARTDDAGDILVFGSRTMWNGLLRDGLVDELHLMVSPNAVGSGTPILDSAVDLDLLEARRFPGSGNVLLRYAVKVNDSAG
ncbi:MAG TPA: dihydrofolate reductase family protein [Propionibacteriaceae bacterium]|nr:dihydrofolate reductase family protein [Propionibacteriaceae bacterium]